MALQQVKEQQQQQITKQSSYEKCAIPFNLFISLITITEVSQMARHRPLWSSRPHRFSYSSSNELSSSSREKPAQMEALLHHNRQIRRRLQHHNSGQRTHGHNANLSSHRRSLSQNPAYHRQQLLRLHHFHDMGTHCPLPQLLPENFSFSEASCANKYATMCTLSRHGNRRRPCYRRLARSHLHGWDTPALLLEAF